MHELDVRIATQLAKDGRALDRLVGNVIQFAEERRSIDLTHAASTPAGATNLSALRRRSSASRSARRVPSQVVQPSCPTLPSFRRGTSALASRMRTSQSSSMQLYNLTQSTSCFSCL